MASISVQRGVKSAKETLQRASLPGIGTSLRRARISKALSDLHTIESQCRSEEDIGHCKVVILLAQVSE